MRSNIAYSRDALASSVLQPTAAATDGRQFALAPTLAAGCCPCSAKAIWQCCTTWARWPSPPPRQYVARSVPLPPAVLAQRPAVVLAGPSAEGAVRGWGGRLGDLAVASNGISTFTCINVTGNAVFLSGDTAIPYQVTTSGPVPVTGIKARFSAPAPRRRRCARS